MSIFLIIVVIFILGFLFWQCVVNLNRYQLHSQHKYRVLEMGDVPTVSLCIPARNETHALTDCLASAIASDYPKLEIIVLDDCSQDRTSQIIKGFAHDGVRFVKGATPSEDWLGKNNAYDTLAREARGDYLVFMSVDTRIEPQALSTLISYLQVNKLSMVSVLPRRSDIWRASVLFATLRYFWQVCLPLGVNTPTASSLWAIHSESLDEAGGFSTYKDKVMIENELARQFFAKSKYHFLVANESLKVWYAKKWSSQVDTAVRLWYPSLQKKLTNSVLAIAAHALLLIVPVFSLAIGLITGMAALSFMALAAVLLGHGLFYYYLRRIQAGVSPVIGTFLLSPIAAQEIILIMASYYQYKRGRVSWKGRNICYPVFRRTS